MSPRVSLRAGEWMEQPHWGHLVVPGVSLLAGSLALCEVSSEEQEDFLDGSGGPTNPIVKGEVEAASPLKGWYSITSAKGPAQIQVQGK